MKPCVYCEELRCLDFSDFYLLLWPGYYTSEISDDWYGTVVDGLDLVLPIQLTVQDLLNPLLVFDFG